MSLTVPDRTVVRLGSVKGVLSPLRLEEVRDRLKKLEELQDPKDYEREVAILKVGFIDGRMKARWPAPENDIMLFSDTGAQQLAREVLPPRFFAGLRNLARLDEEGAQIATKAWQKFAENNHSRHLVRTVNMKLEGHVHRVVRSVHGVGYATYSNLEFVQDLLDNSEEFSSAVVVECRVTDSAMRIRFATLDGATKIAMLAGEDAAILRSPVPVIEAWNSEVGRRRVGLRGGMWRLITTSGCAHWDDKSEYWWQHRGKTARIRSGVNGAYTDLMESANEIASAYYVAQTIDIDDPKLWIEQELGSAKIGDRIIKACVAALEEPSTSPGGTLASVCDAITLVAQLEAEKGSDLFGQYDLERVASSLLAQAQSIAEKDGKIVAKEAA